MALATQYREQGLNMLHEYAHYVEGTGRKNRVSVEAGLMDMLDRMQSGKFKVFKEHLDW